jgi:hypothetical protein
LFKKPFPYLEALSLVRRGTPKFEPRRGESFSEFNSASPSDFVDNFSLFFDITSCGPYGSPDLMCSCSIFGLLSGDWLKANVARLVIVNALRCESGLLAEKSDDFSPSFTS